MHTHTPITTPGKIKKRRAVSHNDFIVNPIVLYGILSLPQYHYNVLHLLGLSFVVTFVQNPSERHHYYLVFFFFI